MRGWFKTLNYEFESHEMNEKDCFEWIVRIQGRRGYDRILVRGVAGEGNLTHLSALRRAVASHDTDEGWLVSARRVSQAARDQANKRENRNLYCYTFDEKIDEDTDFSGYINWLEDEVKRRHIDEVYVPLAATKAEIDPVSGQEIGSSRYDEGNGWVDGYIDLWLNDSTKEHISILGKFGTGKTWFCLHYAWTALQRYLDAKSRGVECPRLPLVIPLRDYAKAVSIESLFSEFFFRKHEIPLLGYSAFDGEAMLVAAGEVGVGEVDVTELVLDLAIRLHEV
jgi:predicted NACHT family NTPase